MFSIQRWPLRRSGNRLSSFACWVRAQTANACQRNGGHDGYYDNPTSREEVSWSKRLRHKDASYD
jgi:hypothetical protein